MKFNWGYKIAAIYMVFVAGILFLVVKSSRQQMDLVTTDYYAEEIKYQEKIDQSNRTRKLSEPVRLTLQEEGIQIFFPKDFQGRAISGHALLYYPADEKKDIETRIQTSQNQLFVAVPDKRSGMHILKLNWEVDGVSYYHEEPVFMP